MADLNVRTLTPVSSEAHDEFDEGFDVLAEMRERGLLGSLEPELGDEATQDVVERVLSGEITVRQSKEMM